jgi:hypothetical protein
MRSVPTRFACRRLDSTRPDRERGRFRRRGLFRPAVPRDGVPASRSVSSAPASSGRESIGFSIGLAMPADTRADASDAAAILEPVPFTVRQVRHSFFKLYLLTLRYAGETSGSRNGRVDRSDQDRRRAGRTGHKMGCVSSQVERRFADRLCRAGCRSRAQAARLPGDLHQNAAGGASARVGRTSRRRSAAHRRVTGRLDGEECVKASTSRERAKVRPHLSRRLRAAL